ncbi:hypothetical protein EON80_15910 [bacterium]|nr:MAG: hypothetical protein EON80_15910 [bacterium]
MTSDPTPPPYQPDAATRSRIEAELKYFYRDIAMWTLLGLGILMVAFAGPIGYSLTPKNYSSSSSFSWNAEDVRNIAQTVRILGFMVFAAGLWERALIEIGKILPKVN